MKNYIIVFLAASLLFACKKDIVEIEDMEETFTEELTALPYQEIPLKDLSTFKPTSDNWKIVGNTYVEMGKEKTIKGDKGSGLLLNIQNNTTKDNIFFNFELGDMELELDVMMPVRSNSGIYFEGTYEV